MDALPLSPTLPTQISTSSTPKGDVFHSAWVDSFWLYAYVGKLIKICLPFVRTNVGRSPPPMVRKFRKPKKNETKINIKRTDNGSRRGYTFCQSPWCHTNVDWGNPRAFHFFHFFCTATAQNVPIPPSPKARAQISVGNYCLAIPLSPERKSKLWVMATFKVHSLQSLLTMTS